MTDDWDPAVMWERAGKVPDGFEVNPLWEQARKAVHSSFQGTAGVTLDWPHVTEGPCVACGSYAYTSYKGSPIHMSCAAEVAMFVKMMGETPRLPEPPRQLK